MLLRKLILFTLLLTMSGYVYGQFTSDGPKGTVVGSDHDLRSKFSGTVVCEYCHVPHKFTTLGSGEPPLLWNVTLKTGPYASYKSSSFNGSSTIRDVSTASATNSAAYMSLLCLSCHDGTVTQATFYQFTSGMGGTGSFTAPNIGGTSGLANDHPVDFTYSIALATADGGVKSPTEGAGVRIPYVGSPALPLYKDQGSDVSGRLECATCHNPHNDSNMPFLRMANSGSALCLNCHG